MIYEPAEDSYLLKGVVSTYAKGKRVLDMGSGSGILAIAAQKAGAESVLAVDIDSEVITHLRSQGIESTQSDLFKKVKGEFDLIVFNPPYLPLDKQEDAESKRITTGGKRGDELILRFLRQAVNHLASKGIILLLVSSLTPGKKIGSLLNKLSLQKKSVAHQKLFMEQLEVYEITRAKI